MILVLVEFFIILKEETGFSMDWFDPCSNGSSQTIDRNKYKHRFNMKEYLKFYFNPCSNGNVDKGHSIIHFKSAQKK